MTKRDVSNDDIMTALTQFATSVDERFKKIDERFMSQEQFNLSLMKRMDETGSRIATILDQMATKEDMRRIEETLDSYAAKIDDYAKEMAAMQHKIDRLERMILYLADKANIPRDVLETV